MSLTYQQSANLMTDVEFQGRIKDAVIHNATYLCKGAWASNVFQNPQIQAQILQPIVVMDQDIQNSSAGDGSDVSDTALQTAVETAVNNML